MKSFDLTFNGTVLPEYDPEQVKLAIARLFSIDDNSELEAIFAGKTVVLRHNLDRKTAAEYFSKIAELGGKATLVKSGDADGDRPGTTPLTPELSLVSRDSSPEPLDTRRPVLPVNFSSDRSVLDEQTRLRGVLSDNAEELSRLRTLMSQLKQRSRQRYFTLQGRKRALQDIADRELCRLEAAGKEALLNTQSKLADLHTEDERIGQLSDSEAKRLEQQQIDRRRVTEDELVSIAKLAREARENELASIAGIEAARESTRTTAEREIKRLQQLLLETQRQAELDDARFEQELDRTRFEARETTIALEQRRIDALDLLEQNITSLSQQQVDIRTRQDAEIINRQRRREELQAQCQQESDQLHARQLAIKNKRDRGVAKVDQACTLLESKTRTSLKKLYAMEIQAKRRQEKALESCQNSLQSTNPSREITSH